LTLNKKDLRKIKQTMLKTDVKAEGWGGVSGAATQGKRNPRGATE